MASPKLTPLRLTPTRGQAFSDTWQVVDMTVGTSGKDINLNSTSITSGGNVTITSLGLDEPVD